MPGSVVPLTMFLPLRWQVGRLTLRWRWTRCSSTPTGGTPTILWRRNQPQVGLVFSSKISFIDFSHRLQKRGAEVGGIDPQIISAIIGLATTVISMIVPEVVSSEQQKSAERAGTKAWKSEQDHYRKMQLRNRVPDVPNRGKATSYL